MTRNYVKQSGMFGAIKKKTNPKKKRMKHEYYGRSKIR